MLLKSAIILLLLQFALCREDCSNGFGKQYDWKCSLKDALADAKSCGKPLMVIIHKSWCPMCHQLASKFAKSETILKLSKNFVMVNCMDNDEPKAPEYSPDGGYIPRVLFMCKDGKPLNCVNVWGNPDYKFYFYDMKQIEKCMRKILAKP